MTDTTMMDRLKEFMECEGRSCSFDSELITPEYVYRMWGGEFSMEDIEDGLAEIRKQGYTTFGITEARI
ncbi:hypothetical protein SAMN05216462_1774 [Xylanibacter ruminicola]|uniref:Uncharacterized protein n=1 Tax=Xylanibacter ruminicola TaxID=839 RepID=A0A1H4C574_XYLRU|nr:hypothetical protein [Xylanibacter ruminicola]SEA55504.1 hypothetical protein SAMN05216462_1774 [Xylanibacter ruminicola]